MRQFNLTITALEANAVLALLAIKLPDLRAEPPLDDSVLKCLESVANKLIEINKALYD